MQRRAIDPVLAGQLALPLAAARVWQLVGMLAGDFYVATPAAGRRRARHGGDWFYGSLGATLFAAFVGFMIAAVAGLWIGVTLGLTRFWGKVFEPVTL